MSVTRIDGRSPIAFNQAIDELPLSRLQYRIAALAFLVMFIDGYDIQAMALGVVAISRDWDVNVAQFGLPLSASLAGMLVAAALIAPLGDRFGRRPLLIYALIVAGVASVATGYASTITGLTIGRALTGVGLGASMPNAVALVSEFMPTRRKSLIVTIVYSGVALGAFTAGILAPTLLKALGWQGIFYLGGWLPLGLAGLLFLFMHESPTFMLLNRRNPERLKHTLSMIGVAPDVEVTCEKAIVKRQSVAALFEGPLRSRTWVLWVLFWLTIFTLYILISWLATLLELAGFTPSQALRCSVMVQAGGVIGGFLLAIPAGRGKIAPALGVVYATAVASLITLGIWPPDLLVWSVLLFIIGIGTAGSQVALTSLAAAIYPPEIRATGLGYAMMVGRLGAVTSAFVGGILVRQEPHLAIAALSLPVLCCCGLVILLSRVMKS